MSAKEIKFLLLSLLYRLLIAAQIVYAFLRNHAQINVAPRAQIAEDPRGDGVTHQLLPVLQLSEKEKKKSVYT